MKRFFYLFVALLLTAVLPAQAQTDGARKVTYTFKGSVVENSVLLNLLGVKQQLYLKSSGDKPAGVQDPDINCTTGGHTPPVGLSHNGGDFQHFDKHLLGGLSTLYVVEENEHAVIDFHNFKYEVARVQWRRRSQHALMTSKGGTWLQNYTGKVSGSYVEYGDEDGIENSPAYSTNGEVLYHTRDFAKYDNGDGTYQRYAGISSFHIDVSSKRSYQGIAVQDFDIYYFRPEPLISYVDNLDGTYTVEVVVGKEQHVGAFSKDDFELDYNDQQLEIVGTPSITVEADNKIHAIYNMQPKVDATGVATVYAKIMNNGQVAGKSQTAIKLQLEEKQGFYYEDVREWFDNNSYTSVVWGKPFDTGNNFTPALSSNPYNGQLKDDTFGDTSWSSWGTTQHATFRSTAKSSGKWFKERAVELSFNLDIPAYTNVTRKVGFEASADGGGVGDVRFVEVINFEDDPVANSQSFAITSKTTVAVGSGASVIFASGTSPSAATFTKNGWGNITSETPLVWSFDNHDSADPATGTKYFMIRGGIRQPTSDDIETRWKFSYYNPTNAYEYDYYTTITYDLDGGTGTNTADQDIHKAVYGDNTKIVTANGGLLSVIPTVADNTLGAEQKLAPTGLTKSDVVNGQPVNYKFLGWWDAEDGVLYAEGAYYNPCNAVGQCGKGPRTLVAQWEPIPSELVVTFMAEGGKVAGEDLVQKQIVYGKSTWKDESNLKAPTSVTKVGYNFQGFTDADGIQQFMAEVGTSTTTSIINTAANKVRIFDASGNLTTYGKNGTYFDSNSKWTSSDDLVLYAMFTLQTGGGAPTKYTITLNANGGATPAKDAEHPYNGTKDKLTEMVGSQDNNNVALYTPTLAGYKFAGWYTAASGGDLVYAADGSAVKLVKMIPEDLNAAPPTPAKPVFSAYNSTYWNDDATWKYAGNVTLYAHWLPLNTEITFDEGGNTSTNSATWAIKSGANGGMNSCTYEQAEYDVVNVVRTLKPGHWNTICFPCDVYKYQCDLLFDKVKVLTDIEMKDGEILLKFSDSKDIASGVPYFVHMKDDYNDKQYTTEWVDEDDHSKGYVPYDAYYTSGTNTLTLLGVEATKTPTSSKAQDADGNWVTMHGNFTTVYHLAEGLIYLQDDKFYESQKEYTVEGVKKKIYGNLRGFRCYFQQYFAGGGGSNQRMLPMTLDLEDFYATTALPDVMIDSDELEGCDIYDLSGRRLSQQPVHGLYIANGKKYIVK